MKKAKIKFVAGLLALVICFSGCGNGNGDDGIKMGFRGGAATLKIVSCAVRSEITEFDINNVTLDFYFGSDAGRGMLLAPSFGENYEPVCFALYFCDYKYFRRVNATIELYWAVDGYYFIKEISADEFASEKYNVIDKRPSDKVFSHYETLNVPSSIFEFENSYFYFIVAGVYYSKKDSAYWLTYDGYVRLHYKIIDEKTVRLSNS